MKKKTLLLYIILALPLITAGIGIITVVNAALTANRGVATKVSAQEGGHVEPTEKAEAGLGYLSAGIAVGMSCIGASIAVKAAVTAGVAAIVEKPELFGKTIIYAGLAEGIAIYGLLIAIMILGKL